MREIIENKKEEYEIEKNPHNEALKNPIGEVIEISNRLLKQNKEAYDKLK